MIFWRFFVDNLPSWQLALWLAPVSAIYSFIWLMTSGWCKRNLGWRTGYTRKLYHFSIFFAAGAVQVAYGYSGTIVFGCSVSAAIFYALWRGDGNMLYEAMAREKDAPRRTHFIIVPYAATLFGGVVSNFFFPGTIAVFGYLVTGLADAVAEPIGTRFGRHKYRVPSVKGVASYRSLEGSGAVFFASCAALAAGVLLQGGSVGGQMIYLIPAVAAIATLTEAVSPHGWDNFTLQIVVNLAAFGLF